MKVTTAPATFKAIQFYFFAPDNLLQALQFKIYLVLQHTFFFYNASDILAYTHSLVIIIYLFIFMWVAPYRLTYEIS